MTYIWVLGWRDWPTHPTLTYHLTHPTPWIAFDTELEHSLFNIQLPMVKQSKNYKSWFTTAHDLWFTITPF
jgi:hypothetical protein